MVNEYWKLNKKPFSNTPNLNFLYNSDEFEEGYARLLYNITEIGGGLSLITGEIGSGKTYLAYALMKNLKVQDFIVFLITNPKISSTQLLKTILQKSGEEKIPRFKLKVLSRLEERLLEFSKNGKSVVCLIDEAQILSYDALREIRLLLNMETAEKKLIHIVFLGQPELKVRIEKTPQLKQRINIRFHLQPLSREETIQYVKHRLSIAGRTDEVFQEEALVLLYRRSKGLPRVINNVAQNALFVGFTEGVDQINSNIIESVVTDLEI